MGGVSYVANADIHRDAALKWCPPEGDRVRRKLPSYLTRVKCRLAVAASEGPDELQGEPDLIWRVPAKMSPNVGT